MRRECIGRGDGGLQDAEQRRDADGTLQRGDGIGIDRFGQIGLG